MSVSVQSEDFDIGTEIAQLRAVAGDIGAIVSFTGTVREMTKYGAITSMTLEHYPGMTERELERVEGQACARWPLAATRIVHRHGELRPAENIVLVITASTHREAAFEAACFLMDYLKTSAPFWKKEALCDGAADWVAASSKDEAAAARWRSLNAEARPPDVAPQPDVSHRPGTTKVEA